MEVYSNENEKVDALRRFFANNGKALAIGVIVGITALGGWRFWTGHQEGVDKAASAQYQQLTSVMQADKPRTLEAVANFASENNNTYGALVSLDLAKQYVGQSVRQSDYAVTERA